MVGFNEGRHPAEFVLSEANGERSRDNITVAASQTLVPGAVVGALTTGGNFVVLAPAASDGSQNAAGIVLYPVTTGVGVTAKVAALTRQAEVNGNCLTWPGGITGPQKTTAIAALAALGIIVR